MNGCFSLPSPAPWNAVGIIIFLGSPPPRRDASTGKEKYLSLRVRRAQGQRHRLSTVLAITADALLTQRKIADSLVRQRKAHYHFTVKNNQSGLFQDIALYLKTARIPILSIATRWNYDEDRSRIRTGHGPENNTRLRCFAISIIKSKSVRSVAQNATAHAQCMLGL